MSICLYVLHCWSRMMPHNQPLPLCWASRCALSTSCISLTLRPRWRSFSPSWWRRTSQWRRCSIWQETPALWLHVSERKPSTVMNEVTHKVSGQKKQWHMAVIYVLLLHVHFVFIMAVCILSASYDDSSLKRSPKKAPFLLLYCFLIKSNHSSQIAQISNWPGRTFRKTLGWSKWWEGRGW